MMMTKRLIYIVFLFTSWLPISAQVNLVPNPSFEEHNSLCNGGYLDTSETVFPAAKMWFTPLVTAAGYFNKCAPTLSGWSVPKNHLGTQFPVTGDAYMLLVLAGFGNLRDDIISMVSSKLTQKLYKDSVYLVSFNVRLCAEHNGYYNDNIYYRQRYSIEATPSFGFGALFYSNTTILDSLIYADGGILPSVTYKKTPFLEDTTNWINISGLYRAKGDEQYIALGNPNVHLTRKDFKRIKDGEYLVWVNNFGISHYYLDDVSVTTYGAVINTYTDTLICLGDSIIISKPILFDSTSWNDLDTSNIRTLNKAGKYWVTYFTGNVTQTDTFVVKLFNPQTTITDTSLCEVESIVLTSNNAAQYVWNTTDTTQSITVNQSGNYWVTKTAAGCVGIDSFMVHFYPNPVITSLKDTTVCFDEIATILLDAGTFKKYLWQPTGETTQTIYSNAAQVYLLSVTDSNNCSTSQKVSVMETCPEFVFIPNAFSPNADGLNDVFLPHTRNLERFEMHIVNQWGQLIFTSTDVTKGWDGKDAQIGTYVVLINFKVTGKTQQSLSGNVTLLR